eukprot:g11119.t1
MRFDPNSPSPAERNRYSSDTLHEFFSSSSAEQAAPEKSTQTIAFQKTAQRDRTLSEVAYRVVKLPYRAEIAAQYSSYMNSDPGQPTSRRLDRWSGFGSPFDAVYGPYADEKFWQIGLRVIRKASSTSAALSNEVSIWNTGAFSHRR